MSNIIYIIVDDHWNYLTSIIDLLGRKIVGWSFSEDMTTKNTVMKACIDTLKTRNISDGFIFHSDKGVQYASNKMKNVCDFNLKET